jgi:hypothetical protein
MLRSIKSIRKWVVGATKVVILLPLWLLVLPVRGDRVFRHYCWTLAGMRRSPFTKKAYVSCLLC